MNVSGNAESQRSQELDGLPQFGQCSRWFQASLGAGMDSLPVIDQELRPNGSSYRRIHTPDPEQSPGVPAQPSAFRSLGHVKRVRECGNVAKFAVAVGRNGPDTAPAPALKMSPRATLRREYQLLDKPGGGEVDPDAAADHVESCHGVDR